MRTVQRFSDEYLESCRDMTPDQIVRFLDDFRRLHGSRPAPSKLISMKVPTDLLSAFKAKAALAGTPYQSKIKELMKAWVVDAPKGRQEEEWGGEASP
jgi:uncharacterized protein (DUF4415 family)